MSENKSLANLPLEANSVELNFGPTNKVTKYIHPDEIPWGEKEAKKNVRHEAGVEVYGVKPKKGTYDIASMKKAIFTVGRVIRPPVLNLRNAKAMKKDKSLPPQWGIIEGNRRIRAVKEILADPNVPQAMKDSILSDWKLDIYHDLTEEQEALLVNDQDSKEFLRSEVVTDIFNKRRQGLTYSQMVGIMWESIAKLTKNTTAIADIRQMPEGELKEKAVKDKFRGTLDCYYIWGYDLGAWMQKQILLSEMRSDGSLTKEDEQPYFLTTTNSQKRIAALRKARQADGSKFSPHGLVEGTEFAKKAAEFREMDFPTVPVVKPGKAKSAMAKAGMTQLLDKMFSSAARLTLQMVIADEPNGDAHVADALAKTLEDKYNLFQQVKLQIRGPMAAILEKVFENPNPDDFRKFLQEAADKPLVFAKAAVEAEVPTTNPNAALTAGHPGDIAPVEVEVETVPLEAEAEVEAEVVA